MPLLTAILPSINVLLLLPLFNISSSLEANMDKHLEDFPALGLFLFGHYHLGKSSIEFEYTNAWLVEAAFGRIKFLEGVPKTVLDEPFVLKATINYLQVKDPLLISTSQRAMQLSDSPSAQGSMWKVVMPSIFVKIFNSRPHTRNLSFWSLSTRLPEDLNGNVTIVGYDEQGRTLTVSHPTLTMHQFMNTHAKNGFKQNDENNNNIYPCFVHLKLRKLLMAVRPRLHLKLSAEMEQESTTSTSSDQQQPRLQDYCPNGKYISMVIVYPAKVKDDDFQAIRPDPSCELEGLERVSIKVDGSNFSDIFPSGHVKFLNILKEYKRPSEDELPQQSKRNKTDHDS
ncbi:hypothetical protein BDF22DRAFT_688047 [Syncephalis plumigaleata]|nr:hypothetical protein BDF22DRAFT_688047 [Syncephalis plumigaleata]